MASSMFTSRGQGLQSTALSRQFAHQIRTHVNPLIYDSSISNWRNLEPLDLQGESEQVESLEIVSWNVDFSSSGPATRIATLLSHIRDIFGGRESHLVILLQEVCLESLLQIREIEWLHRNFTIIGDPPPMIIQDGMKRSARYFNLILTPRALTIKNVWRLGLPSEMGRNALFLDIPIESIRKSPNGDDQGVVRLCTTHLESLPSGMNLRKKQLMLISQHLKCKEDKVECGLIGGDFNSIQDHEDFQPVEMGLTDSWTRCSDPLSHGNPQKNDFHGREEGHTWGYQSFKNRFPPRRFDKFLYFGSIEIVPAYTVDGRMEKVQRLGIDVRTDITVGGDSGSEKSTRSVWVSDHFGIALKIKIL